MIGLGLLPKAMLFKAELVAKQNTHLSPRSKERKGMLSVTRGLMRSDLKFPLCTVSL